MSAGDDAAKKERHREKHREYQRKYREAHPEEVAERKRASYATNRAAKGIQPRGFEVSYGGAHDRARTAHRGEPCAMQDATCSGRLEVAFRHDTPPAFVRVEPKTGSRYSPRGAEDYFRLCCSHHKRYDAGHPALMDGQLRMMFG